MDNNNIVYSSAAYDELKASAFEVVLTHPGCGYDEWLDTLLDEYTTEVIDAFGTDEAEMERGLAELWHAQYHDLYSGENHTIEQWAKKIASEEALEEYYQKQK